MSWRFCTLVRRDHDDLDLALGAMVATATSCNELAELLDVAQLSLAVHVAAETKALAELASLDLPVIIRMAVLASRDEHRFQQEELERLVGVRAGSELWYARVLELRIQVLDHATRAELLRWTFDDHLGVAMREVLAKRYASERMRVLGRTSPVAIAAALTVPPTAP